MTSEDASFQQIAEAMPQLVWTSLAGGGINYVNRRWIEYTGFSLDDLRNGDPASMVHPDDANRMWDVWRGSLASGEPYEIEYRLRDAATGSYRWFLARAVPQRDETGEILRWIGTATDVDEQRRSRDSMEFVVEAGAILSITLEEEAICNRLAQLAIRQFADWCFVTLLRPDGSYENAAIAHRNDALVRYLEQFRDRYPVRGDSPVVQAVMSKKPLLIPEVTQQTLENAAEDEQHLRLLQLLEMRSVMVVPLAAPQHPALGTLTLVSARSGHPFNDTDVAITLNVAERAAGAILNARMLEDEKRNAQRLGVSAKAGRILLESTGVSEIMQNVADLVAQDIADASIAVCVDGDMLRLHGTGHRNPALQRLLEPLKGQRLMRPGGEAGLMGLLHERHATVRDAQMLASLREHLWPFHAEVVNAALAAKSFAVLPLYGRDALHGAIFAYYRDREPLQAEADLPLLEDLAARTTIALEASESRERERHIAQTLQQASLPTLIPQPDDLRFDAVYAPAGEDSDIGGDWYDAIELDDGSVVISAGDVAGRGIEAAVIMSKVRHAMGVVPRHERDPARILDSAGWFLQKRYPDATVTAFVGIVNPERTCLHYANAGHPPPLLRRGEELIELRGPGLPLGVREMAPDDRSVKVDLEAGDLLLLYTDGLTEWGRDWCEGEERLRQVLRSDAILHTAKPAEMIRRICIPPNAHDDVAVLAVTVGPTDRWTLRAENARAAETARTEFVAHLREAGADPAFASSAELIFGELVGNVVRHAPGPIEIQYENERGAPVLHVIDYGPPFKLNRRQPEDPLSESGRGLYIVSLLSPQVEVERVGDTANCVRAILPAA